MLQPHKIKAIWCGAAAERADDRQPLWREMVTRSAVGARRLNAVDLQAPSIGAIEAATSSEGHCGWAVDVTWPDADTVRTEFYGNGYGPTAMTTLRRDGAVIDDRDVKWPGMFGPQLSSSWIQRFFGYGRWNADCSLESKELSPDVVSCLIGGFDSKHIGSEGPPRWISFARLTPASVFALLGCDLDNSQPPLRSVYAFPVVHDDPGTVLPLNVEWVSGFLQAPVVGDHHRRRNQASR